VLVTVTQDLTRTVIVRGDFTFCCLVSGLDGKKEERGRKKLDFYPWACQLGKLKGDGKRFWKIKTCDNA